MERTEIGIGNMRIDVVDDNALFINTLLLWLRGYVIFENKKIIFFNLKIKLLYRPKVIHNFRQLILFSPLLSHVLVY